MITECQFFSDILDLMKSDLKISVRDINIIYNYMSLYNNFRSYIEENFININNSNLSKLIEFIKKIDKKYKKDIILILEKMKYILTLNNNTIIVESPSEISSENKDNIVYLLSCNNIEVRDIKYLVNSKQEELNETIIIKVGHFILKLSFINFIMKNIQDKKSINLWQFVYEQ